MLLHKFILFSLLGFTFLQAREHKANDYAPPVKSTLKWAVQKSSTLSVEGKSNINAFRCDIEKYYQLDTIICYNEAVAKPVRLKGSLKLDVFTFDCHSKMITKDLRKTLKADDYPKLIIQLISLERAPVFDGNTDIIKGWVNVELAGVTKKFEILYSFIKPGSSVIILNGGRTFNFSDFNLKPPRKLAGIIQINDEFSVHFRLNLVPFN